MATNFIEITTSEKFQLDRPEMIDKTLLKSDFMPYRPHSQAGINDTAPFNITIQDKMLLLIFVIVIFRNGSTNTQN